MALDLPKSDDTQESKLNPLPEPVPVVSSAVPESADAPMEASTATSSAGVLPGDGQRLDEAAKQEFLWHIHEYLGEYARFGDTKAGFTGTAAAALLGVLYGAKVHSPMVQMSYHQWALTTWLAAISISFLVVSVLLAVWTIRPRLGTTQEKGFIYWGSIAAHKQLDLLQTSFHGQSARTLNDHLLHHVFDISNGVCVPKYRYVSLCMGSMAVGGVLCGVVLLMQDAKPSSLPILSAPVVQLVPPPIVEPSVKTLPAAKHTKQSAPAVQRTK